MDGRRFKLIDTAGIRKRARVSSSIDGAEPLSVGRAINAVRCAAARQLQTACRPLACSTPMRAFMFVCIPVSVRQCAWILAKPHVLHLERLRGRRVATCNHSIINVL